MAKGTFNNSRFDGKLAALDVSQKLFADHRINFFFRFGILKLVIEYILGCLFSKDAREAFGDKLSIELLAVYWV